MDGESLKSTNPSFWADFQFVGLRTAGISAMNRTMLFGGKITEQMGASPYTGKVELIVNQGGLTNKVTPAAAKELFKQEILPVLAEKFPGVGLKYTGRMNLHFREGLLTTFSI